MTPNYKSLSQLNTLFYSNEACNYRVLSRKRSCGKIMYLTVTTRIVIAKDFTQNKRHFFKIDSFCLFVFGTTAPQWARAS